jgi:hypothetical protein
VPRLGDRSDLVTDADVAWLYANCALLRRECTEQRWPLLYSSARHGRSFTTLRTTIMAEGPNVIVVRDTGHALFGAVAHTWLDRRPVFYGTGAVFSLTAPRAVYDNPCDEPCMYMDCGSLVCAEPG